MTLILEAHVFDRYIPLAQCRYDLLGLTDGYTRVVGAMDD